MPNTFELNVLRYCVPDAISYKLKPKRPLAVELIPSCSVIFRNAKSLVQDAASPEILQTVSSAS
jgi:hypothetical protein